MKYPYFYVGVLGVLCCTMSSAIAQESSAGLKNRRPIGELRGVDLVDTHLKTHFFDAEHPQTGGFKIEKVAGSQIQGLAGLLGKYVDGERRRFSGGAANPFNILVWRRLIDEFSFQVSLICSEPYQPSSQVTISLAETSYRIDSGVAERLLALCRYETMYNLETQRGIFSYLWKQMVGYGYSAEEESFIQYFSSYMNNQGPGMPLVADVMGAMMLHPGFLLAR